MIARAFFWVKYVEEVGTGTNKIIKWCEEWKLPEPEFEETGTSFVVILRRSKLTEELMDKLGLNERQKRTVDYLKKQDRITTKKYCEIFKVVKDTANRDLNNLIDKGLIKRNGSGPKVYYTLSAG